MLKRTISGAVLIVIMIVLIILGGIPFGAFMMAVSLVAVFELCRACKVHDTGVTEQTGYTNIADLGDVNAGKRKPPRKLPFNLIEVFAYMTTVLLYVLITYYSRVNNLDSGLYDDGPTGVVVRGLASRISEGDAILALIVIFILIVLAVYVLTYPKFDIRQVMSVIFITVYAPLMISFMYRTRVDNGGGMEDMIMTFLIIITASGSDMSAYFVGVNLGKHKLAPVLSPKKSIEGAIGGVLGASLLNTVFALALCAFDLFELKYIWIFALIGAVGSLISQIGDLAASAIKRSFDIKDYGSIIPGHGGAMDRLDSILVVAPIIYMMIRLLQ